MNTHYSDSIWLNDQGVCRIEHLAEMSGLSIEDIEDLVDNGVIVPVDQSPPPRTYYLQYVVTVKVARRLRDDFQLDRHGLTLALTLLSRIDELQGEVSALRAKHGGAA
ncbi:MAG: hypothetical protein H7315_19070 [Herminiimonas sp.]|nr:hypothetical protein [Herminiimonas sp.]